MKNKILKKEKLALNKFLTAVEIGKLNIYGLPTTKSAILSRAAKEGWEYREVTGLGGVRKEFKLPKRYRPKTSITSTKDNQLSYHASTSDYKIWAGQINQTKFIPIRYCKDLQMLAETNLFSSRNPANAVLFHQKFITQHLKANPKDLICIYVQSDSMNPTIRKTGIAMFDLSKGYCGEGVYLIRQGEELKIKRIQKLTATTMLIISDYKVAYPAVEIDLSQSTPEDFAIMGMYLWDAGITV